MAESAVPVVAAEVGGLVEMTGGPDGPDPPDGRGRYPDPDAFGAPKVGPLDVDEEVEVDDVVALPESGTVSINSNGSKIISVGATSIVGGPTCASTNLSGSPPPGTLGSSITSCSGLTLGPGITGLACETPKTNITVMAIAIGTRLV